MSPKLDPATHFYVDPCEVHHNLCTLSREESDHILRVFRHQVGDPIKVTDGEGNLYDVRLTAVDRKAVCGEITNVVREVNELDRKITVGFGISRQMQNDQIIDQCTQLGVGAFLPLKTECSVSRIGDKLTAAKLDRWRRVAISAMKQSLRTRLPVILPPVAVADLARSLSQYDLSFFASFKGSTLRPSERLTRARTILLVTGPERGMSDAEEGSLILAGAIPVSLGARRLRAELAPVMLTTLLLAAIA